MKIFFILRVLLMRACEKSVVVNYFSTPVFKTKIQQVINFIFPNFVLYI